MVTNSIPLADQIFVISFIVSQLGTQATLSDRSLFHMKQSREMTEAQSLLVKYERNPVWQKK